MIEYIKRSSAIEAFDADKVEWSYSDVCEDVCSSVIRTIENIPAEDVQPVVHGMWLSQEYMYGDPDVGIEDGWVERRAEQSDDYAYCSVCKKKAGYDLEQNLILSDYCPSCGAKMDLDNNK